MDCGLLDFLGMYYLVCLLLFFLVLLILFQSLQIVIVLSFLSGVVCVGFRDEIFGRIVLGKWKGYCYEFFLLDVDGGKVGLKCDVIFFFSIFQKWLEDGIGNFDLVSKDDLV